MKWIDLLDEQVTPSGGKVQKKFGELKKLTILRSSNQYDECYLLRASARLI